MSSYELWMTDGAGVRLSKGPLDHTLGFSCSRVVNNVGRLRMLLPVNFNRDLIIPDSTMIQVWRTPPGGANSLWNTYHLDGFEFSHVDATEKIEIFGGDMLDIPRRRKIAYFTNTAFTNKNAIAADDMIKEFFDEQLVNPMLYSDTTLPDPARDLSAYLSIAANLTAGPVLNRRASWSNFLLSTCQAISQAARQTGTEIFFDIVPDVIGSNSMTWRLVTKTGQPGADLTSGSNQVVFSQERKNMKNPSYSEDWADSQNFIYGAGQGESDKRIIGTAEDTTRSLRGIWARREGYAEARNQAPDVTAVQDVANAILEERRPVRKFNAQPISLPGSRFGVDWNFGDKVISKYLNFEFETIIRAVQITVTAQGGEQVRANLDWRAA